MTTLKHKTPCAECPWRRAHTPGWLGGYQVDDFLLQVQRDGPPLPCHMTIHEGRDAEAMCAGALIFMKNSVKSAQHPDYGDALDQVEKDTTTVFQWPHEFKAHHEQDVVEWVSQRRREEAVRKRRFDSMTAHTDDDAKKTILFGMDVATMSAAEQEIVLWWALSKLKKAIQEDRHGR